jgi:hypothetical protein
MLRGRSCFANEVEKDMSKLATTEAMQRQLRFMARCLAIREEAVKSEGFENALIPLIWLKFSAEPWQG